jgi:hypothetical protein
MTRDTLKAPRYEVKACWERGEKLFAICDLERGGAVVGIFDSAHDACVQCTVLWLEHLKTGDGTRAAPRRLPPDRRWRKASLNESFTRVDPNDKPRSGYAVGAISRVELPRALPSNLTWRLPHYFASTPSAAAMAWIFFK